MEEYLLKIDKLLEDYPEYSKWDFGMPADKQKQIKGIIIQSKYSLGCLIFGTVVAVVAVLRLLSIGAGIAYISYILGVLVAYYLFFTIARKGKENKRITKANKTLLQYRRDLVDFYIELSGLVDLDGEKVDDVKKTDTCIAVKGADGAFIRLTNGIADVDDDLVITIHYEEIDAILEEKEEELHAWKMELIQN